MSGITKFSPEELEELRKFDAEVDAEAEETDKALDFELDCHAIAQNSDEPSLTPEQVKANRQRAAEYYQKHRAEINSKSRAYYREHREEHRAYMQKYYREHKAEYDERAKKRREKNRDRRRKTEKLPREREET